MFGNSRLGFGCMRLPMVGEAIDHECFAEMVDAFLAAGGRYFDTAHVYHKGASETAIKAALTDRYPRERYILTDKLTTICFEEEKDILPLFEKQLAACGVTYFDNYLFHAMRSSYHEKFTACNAFEIVKGLKAEGRIRHIGMSFHDSPEFLRWVLEHHPEIEMVQLQFNYADGDNPDVESLRCYEICCEFGKPVIVMEPVKGGRLAQLPPEGQALLPEGQAAFALRYCASFPQIKMILSGMSSPEQMEDNLRTMENPAPFTEAEHSLALQLREIVRRQETIACTECRYCMDACPMEIPIPELFGAYNARKLRQPYAAPENRGENCADCGACEAICPQHLEIRKLLKRCASVLK